MGYDEREIEHVDDLAVKEIGIACAERHKMGYRVERRVVEHQAVEHRVEQVARRSCQHHGHAHHIAPSVLTMDQAPQIVADSADGHQAEQAEHQFVEERHAIGHAVVLYEKDLEPVGNVDRLANAHVCLDPYLDGLVDDKQ